MVVLAISLDSANPYFNSYIKPFLMAYNVQVLGIAMNVTGKVLLSVSTGSYWASGW